MAGCTKSRICVLFLLFCKEIYATRAEEAKEELVGSESKDGKLEIIKQIKKVNEDGSYTIGYEADDGSFKIESRDVLGNIKGTYGYIDDAGEIKRVSYSTNSNNKSEIVSKPNSPSVVQRIPSRTNRTSTTRKPHVVYSSLTTQSTPTTTNVVQTIPKRKTASSTTSTTESSKIGDFIKAAVDAAKTTTAKAPNIIYATPSSARLTQFQPKSLLKSTTSTQTDVQKSEGQLVRPEIITNSPTDVPLYRRVILRNPILDNEATNIKPVTEEPEVRGNLLRRQLSQERSFDARQHIYNLQQSLGDDSTDVYSASVTTGTPRPLFTTTARSKPLSSTTYSPLHRPSIRFPVYHQRSVVREVPQVSNQIAQETATTESTITENKYTTPNPVPVVQIPANRQSPVPLVAIRHPFHGGTILVPVSQLQGRDLHPETAAHVAQSPTRYVIADQQYLRETTQNQQRNPDPHSVPIYVRRIPPPLVRSIPVQVDENGYIREIPQEAIARIPYPVPIPITPPPQPQPKQQSTNEGVGTEIDHIMPPVSTRDFQKLLEQLIIRQTRLERISDLTNPRRHPELYQQNYQQIYQQPTAAPYYIQNQPDNTPNIHYVQNQRHYISAQQTQSISQQHQQPVIVRPQAQTEVIFNREQYGPVTYPPHTDQYTPNRRVARVLNSRSSQQEVDEDYLPPEVREMLLLRMLQLAINPALPLDVPDIETMIATPAPQIKKAVRNVQILGEEDDEPKRPSRNKRYWDYNKDSFN